MRQTIRKQIHEITNLDAEKDRQQEILIDLHGQSATQDECEHTPNQLMLQDTSFEEDRIINHFKCECGTKLEEIFTLSRTQIIR